MHLLILLAGVAGAWLLFAGPVQQAVIELSEEDFERERFQGAMAEMPPPRRLSAWWWLLPPVRLYLGRRERERWQQEFLDHLPDDDYVALTTYMAKARSWLLVGAGGFLIAVKETYELVEDREWPVAVFWTLVVVFTAVALGSGAALSARRSRRRSRPGARRDGGGDNGVASPRSSAG